MENAIIWCEKCGSTKIVKKCQYADPRNSSYIMTDYFCGDCDYLSQAKGMLDDPIVLQNCVDNYKKANKINENNEEKDMQFKELIVKNIKAQVIKTFLYACNGSLINEKVGDIDLQQMIKYM